MFKKLLYFLTLSFFLLAQNAFANMASPYHEGTKSASALSSKDINILSEQIHFKTSKDFSTAKFTITYTIQNNITESQIPLLFLAIDYKKEFKVWLDDQPVKTQNIPDEYIEFKDSKFRNFDNNFKSNEGETEQVQVSFQKNSTEFYDLHELKYFEANLSKGTHQIRVEYTADVWDDRSDWVKSLSFRYSLSPAKNWKSFGDLTIELEQEGTQAISSNLGNGKKKGDQITLWKFNRIPADYIEINHKAEQSAFVNILINISPDGFMYYSGILFLLIHLFLLYTNRHSSPKRSNTIVIMGSILVPLLSIVVYNLSFGFIDNMIGADASKFHGYYILLFLTYPFIALFYWLFIYLINRFGIRNLN